MRGYTLTEVLISFLIFSFLLIAMDLMEVKTLIEAKNNYYFAVAAQQIHSIVERLSVSKGEYINDYLTYWNKCNHDLLPQGNGEVSGHYPSYRVTLAWGKSTAKACDQVKVGASGCLKIFINLI